MIGLSDFYLKYPYKCYDYSQRTRPYVSKKECDCNHIFNLTHKQYKLIVQTYFKYLFLYLRSGLIYKMPFRMGRLQLVKYRGGYYDYDKEKFYKNDYMFNNKFVIKWDRRPLYANMKRRYWWTLKLSKKSWLDIFNWIQESPSRIKTFEDK